MNNNDLEQVEIAITNLESENLEDKIEAIRDLAKMQRHIDSIIYRALDPNPFIRSAVAEALGSYEAQDVMDSLEALLRDENPYVKQSALLAVRRLRLVDLLDDVRGMVEMEYGHVRGIALRTLGVIGSEQDHTSLLRGLADRHPAIRRGAAIGIAATHHPDLLPAIQKNILNQLERGGGDTKVMASLVKSLETCDGPSRDSEIVMRVLREAPNNRSDAAVVIGNLRIQEARVDLERGLTDVSTKLRRSCLRALGAINSIRSLSLIRECLRDPESAVREAASDVVGKMEDRDSLGELEMLLRDKNTNVRLSAMSAMLNLIKNEDVDGWLRDLILDNNPKIRELSVKFIVEKDTPNGKRVLLAALENERVTEVSDIIRAAIVSISERF